MFSKLTRSELAEFCYQLRYKEPYENRRGRGSKTRDFCERYLWTAPNSRPCYITTIPSLVCGYIFTFMWFVYSLWQTNMPKRIHARSWPKSDEISTKALKRGHFYLVKAVQKVCSSARHNSISGQNLWPSFLTSLLGRKVTYLSSFPAEITKCWWTKWGQKI